MKKIELNKKTIIITLALIILLQSIVYFVVATNKNYIHMDEGYSHALINYDIIDIIHKETTLNNWQTKEYYQDYLTVGEEEKYDWSPVYNQQKIDVHPPFYYLLLRIANSFSIDNFSIWPGVILNMVIHIGITIFTYLIASKIFKNKAYGLAIAFFSGLTMSAFETIVLIRMYALTALAILVTTYVHIINLEKEKINIKNMIAIATCAVLGSLTHYYYLIYLFILYVIYITKYIIKKQYKEALTYTLTMVIAGNVSLLIFPYSFVHMFSGYRGQGMIAGMTNATFAWNGIGTYIGLTIKDIFNGLLIVILVAIIGILIYEFIKKKEIVIKATNKYLWLTILPTLVYFVVIAMGTPYKEIRYMLPVAPLLFIIGIYAFKIALEKVFTEKKVNIIMIVSAVILLIIPVIFNWNITYQYADMKDIVSTIEEKHATPALYIFNKYCNRFMDDIYLFEKIDKSYIMDSDLATADKITKVLSEVDIANGIILFINEGLENDDYIDIIIDQTELEKCEYMKRLNACDVYYLY